MRNELIIPGTVKKIGSQVFEGTKITSVKFEDGVQTIEDCAFEQCYSLTSVTIPTSVTSIGESFNACTGLKNIYYNGTQEQWNKITKPEDSKWNFSGSADSITVTVIFTDGQITLTA